jgi:phosphopantothenoylcysteine synthetase/decarboxylase
MRILVTSGGTKIPIDMVRNITNMSKGTFGSKIASELLQLGHEVYFFRAEHSRSPMEIKIDFTKTSPEEAQKRLHSHAEFAELYGSRYREMDYATFDQYCERLERLIRIERFDIVMLAAAVSDYGVENPFGGKVRSDDLLQIKLKRLPKIIGMIKEWHPTCKLVGFKLLVKSMEWQLVEAAKKSIMENKCDMVVANDLQDIKDGKHRVHLVFPKEETHTYFADKNDPNALARMVAMHTIKL